MKDARDSSRRTFLRQQEYAKEKQAELSFQPTISEASRDLVSNNAGKSSKTQKTPRRRSSHQEKLLPNRDRQGWCCLSS